MEQGRMTFQEMRFPSNCRRKERKNNNFFDNKYIHQTEQWGLDSYNYIPK